jgi:predicted ATP-grasp superfamily ATP-dependent carboligase
VVGLKENGLGVARALKAASIECIGVDSGNHPAHATNACLRIKKMRQWGEKSLVAAMQELGSELDGRAPVLITQDEAVRWISRNRHLLAKHFHLVLPEQESVDTLMNKMAFLKVATQESWPIPRTWSANNKEELLSVLPDISFPAILKPQVKTQRFRQNGPKKKAYHVRSIDQLLDAYDLFREWEPEIVVQEWIGGGDDRIAFCLTYAQEPGQCDAMFVGRKLRQWPIMCGNTAICEPAPEEWNEPIRKITKAIWRKVGFIGLGSVEFKIRPGTNEPVIMEPTVGRTNYQNELAVLNGCNIPAIAYRRALQLDAAGMCVRPLNPSSWIKLVDGGREVQSAISYMKRGELTLGEWMRSRSGTKRYMLWRLDDTGPALTNLPRAIRRNAAKASYRILGKARTQRISRMLLRPRKQ